MLSDKVPKTSPGPAWVSKGGDLAESSKCEMGTIAGRAGKAARAAGERATGKTRQREINSKFFFDGRHDIEGKSSFIFWGIFIKIPKFIPRVATVVYIIQCRSLGMLQITAGKGQGEATLGDTCSQGLCRLKRSPSPAAHHLCNYRFNIFELSNKFQQISVC